MYQLALQQTQYLLHYLENMNKGKTTLENP